MTEQLKTYNQLLQILQADPIFKEKVFPADFATAVQQENNDFLSGKPGTYNNADVYKNCGLPGAFMGVADAWQNAIGFNETTHSALWQIFSQWKTYVATNPNVLTEKDTTSGSGSGFFNGVVQWVENNPLFAGGIAAAIFILFTEENKKT